MPYRQNFPIPAVIDPPKQCLCIQIPNHPDWKAVISGLLFELTYWFNWERTGDMSGAECAAVWKLVYNSIDWSDMSCCCDTPAIIVRVNATTGNVEQSDDGGLTWQTQPGGLPSVIVQPIPPVTSGVAATKCDAATNVSVQVGVWIDQVSNDFTTAVSLLEFGVAVLEAILIAVVTILSAGTLTAVEALVLPTIAAALFAAWGAGKTVFDAYWSTEVRDAILCAVFEHIGDDGSFTDEQFSATWSQINVDIPASAPKMLFMGFLSSVGAAGLNAMAATGTSADSDCSDCEATCWDKFTIIAGTLVSVVGNVVTIESEFVSPYHNINISTGDPDECCYMLIPTTDGYTSTINWIGCGDPIDGDHLHFGMVGPETVNTINLFQTSGSFTATYTF